MFGKIVSSWENPFFDPLLMVLMKLAQQLHSRPSPHLAPTSVFTTTKSITTTSLKDTDWSLNTQTYWISLRGEPFKTDLWEFGGETSEKLPCKVSWGAHRSLRGRLNMYPDTWAVIQFRQDTFHYETFSTRQNDSVWCNASHLSNVDIRFQCVWMCFVVLTHDKRKKTIMILETTCHCIVIITYVQKTWGLMSEQTF